MPYWKIPPKIKIYEALGSLADRRVQLDGNSAKVYSSSGNKYYTVSYDAESNSIMCNDNGSYWQGYLGYPAICFLLAKGIITYSESVAILLKDIKWKDVNTKFKNDWDRTEKYADDIVVSRGGNLDKLKSEIDRIYDVIKNSKYSLLGPKTKPPTGY